MFKTRKQLMKEIDSLNEKLKLERHKTRKTGFINAAALPPCESLACINCYYFVYQKIGGSLFPLGCGKNISCKDFKPKQPITEEEKQSLQSEMQRQSQS